MHFTKKVHTPRNTRISEGLENASHLPQLIKNFAQEGHVSPKEMKFNALPNNYVCGGIDDPTATVLRNSDNPELLAGISDGRIIKILNEITLLLRNPERVAECLKDLDNELGKRMKKAGITFNDADLPEYLIAGKGGFVAGPKPEGYIPRKKLHILNKLLAEKEAASGINVEGYAARFVGFVNSDIANKFVETGHVYSEDEQVDSTLIHGKFFHRFQLYIIEEGRKKGYLPSLEGVTQKQLLAILATTAIKIGDNILPSWALTLDSLADSITVRSERDSVPSITQLNLENGYDEFFKPKNYSYSSRSPATLKSILTCFGKEIGLPNLQHYLLDSHWKQGDKMIDRVLVADVNKDLAALSKSDIYTHCMDALSCDGHRVGTFKPKPFTLSPKEAALLPKYQNVDGNDNGIKKKITNLRAAETTNSPSISPEPRGFFAQLRRFFCSTKKITPDTER